MSYLFNGNYGEIGIDLCNPKQMAYLVKLNLFVTDNAEHDLLGFGPSSFRSLT